MVKFRLGDIATSTTVVPGRCSKRVDGNQNSGRNPSQVVPYPPLSPAEVAVNTHVLPLLHITPTNFFPTFVCTVPQSTVRPLSSSRRLFPPIYEHPILSLADIQSLVVPFQVFPQVDQGETARDGPIPHLLCFAGRWTHPRSANKTVLNVRKFHLGHPPPTEEEHPHTPSSRTPEGPQSTHYPTIQPRRALWAANVKAVLESCICCHRDRRGFH